MINFSPFDAADCPDSDAAIAACLSATLEDDDLDLFLTAVNDAASTGCKALADWLSAHSPDEFSID